MASTLTADYAVPAASVGLWMVSLVRTPADLICLAEYSSQHLGATAATHCMVCLCYVDIDLPCGAYPTGMRTARVRVLGFTLEDPFCTKPYGPAQGSCLDEMLRIVDLKQARNVQ